jgi:hypothetical protein
VDVFHWLEGVAGRGTGGAVFFDIGGFAGGASQGLDQAGEGAGIATEETIEVARFRLAEGQGWVSSGRRGWSRSQKFADTGRVHGLIQFTKFAVGPDINVSL